MEISNKKTQGKFLEFFYYSDIAKCFEKSFAIGTKLKYLSSNLLKNPIIVPFNAVIIKVPKLIPTNLWKNKSVIIVPNNKQLASKQVLVIVRLNPNFSLTPFTKKS